MLPLRTVQRRLTGNQNISRVIVSVQPGISIDGVRQQVTLLMSDYRDREGRYDRLVSIEMIEAIGPQYLETYFAKASSLLEPDGMGLVQAITIEDHRYAQALRNVDYRAMVVENFRQRTAAELQSRGITGATARRTLEALGVDLPAAEYVRVLCRKVVAHHAHHVHLREKAGRHGEVHGRAAQYALRFAERRLDCVECH